MAEDGCTKKSKMGSSSGCDERDQSIYTDTEYADEVWLEIVSRLPMKDLMICKCVCRTWREIVEYIQKQILKNPGLLPLCGLILRFPRDRTRLIVLNLKYMCLQSGLTTNFPYTCVGEDQRVTVTSGYDNGLLAGLKFELSSLTNCIFTTTRADSQPIFRGPDYAMTEHNGLFLLSRGTYEVINPFTKEVFVLEAEFDCFLQSPGIIVTFPTLPSSTCEFMVVRFSPWCNAIHLYCSQTREWESSQFSGDLLPDQYISANVTHVDGLDSFLYFLTNSSVVALKFRGRNPPKMVSQCVFSLPRFEKGRPPEQSKLWICGEELYLIYYTLDGLAINLWKHRIEYYSTKADSCAWTPLVDVSKRIKDFVGGCSHGVQIVACNPDVAVIYIRLKCSIFAYDLTRDTLSKITDIETIEYTYVHSYLYKPCLSSFKALK